MATDNFDSAKLALLNGDINWTGAVIKGALVKEYTANFATHTYVSDVPVTLYNATALTGCSLMLIQGVAWYTANPLVFASSPNDMASYYAVLVYQASGPGGGADLPASQQRLIGMWDNQIQPVGSPVTIDWSGADNVMLGVY
jgi:hypothetical protein